MVKSVFIGFVLSSIDDHSIGLSESALNVSILQRILRIQNIGSQTEKKDVA